MIDKQSNDMDHSSRNKHVYMVTMLLIKVALPS